MSSASPIHRQASGTRLTSLSIESRAAFVIALTSAEVDLSHTALWAALGGEQGTR